MPTEKFKYPLTETERNELITVLAAYEQIELRDLASIFNVAPARIDQIIHATLQRLFPDDERLFYLSAKAAIQEYSDRLLQSEEINRRLQQIREKEIEFEKRKFVVGETVLYAKHNDIVIAVDDTNITLTDGSKINKASITIEKVETKTQLEIPFPRKKRVQRLTETPTKRTESHRNEANGHQTDKYIIKEKK